MTANRPFPRKEWSHQAWSQLKAITKKELISLLKKGPRWESVGGKGSVQVFRNRSIPQPYDRVGIHFHPGDTFREPALLRMLPDQICWTEESLRDGKVIK